MRVWGVDIHTEFHEKFNHFIVTCANSIVKGCDTIIVRFTGIIHLRNMIMKLVSCLTSKPHMFDFKFSLLLSVHFQVYLLGENYVITDKIKPHG